MSGAIPPLPNTPSWRGAQLKKAQGQLYLLPLPITLKLHVSLQDFLLIFLPLIL
jgi:hypothetical protein